jgi:UDP-N-acetylglucosamine--N-acetylmuramyl-(pentapeptide) pyrophosphoryl-undecaprenol N-acetylglucosamine transferase
MYKLIITGGHFTPGLALIESLDRKDWDIFWIGDDRAVSGTDVKTLESQVLPGIKIPFFRINTVKLQRSAKLISLLSSWKLIYGLVQCIILLRQIKPDVVLTLGSYVSFPVASAARILGIPIIAHEQTSASGLANRIVAKFARNIAISFPESAKYFPEKKTILTGNLVRKSIFEIGKKRKDRKINRTPIIYVTGGSRGAQSINQAVGDILETLLTNFEVYHQCGSLDYELLNANAGTLPKSLSKNYHLQPNYIPSEVEKIFSICDLSISRAGANTVSELAIIGIPSILVPLPNTEQDEQGKNARMLERAGIAEIIPQQEISGAKLLHTIKEMVSNLEKYTKNIPEAQKLVPEDACLKLIKILESANGKN